MSHRRGGEKLQAQVPAVISVPWIKLREQMGYHGIEMVGINLKHIKVKTVNECNYTIIVKFNIYIYTYFIFEFVTYKTYHGPAEKESKTERSLDLKPQGHVHLWSPSGFKSSHA